MDSMGEVIMIIRVARAKISEGKVEEFMTTIERMWIPWLKAQDGMLGCYPGIDGKAREFLMVSLWESMESLRAIGGEHWDKAQISIEALDLLEEVYIRHYEALSQV